MIKLGLKSCSCTSVKSFSISFYSINQQLLLNKTYLFYKSMCI